jgi:gamma-glutamylputrescine oxidase
MNVLYANDQPGVYPASYYYASANPLEAFSALAGQITCDVCIIGAGFTGLSAGLHLALSGYDVVLVDAHRIGWGASGRNGGQLSSGLRVEQPVLEKMLGVPKAKGLWQLGRQANQLVRDLIADNGIDCELKDGVIHANHRARYSVHSQKEAEHLHKNYGYDKIRYIEKSEIRDMLGTNAYFSGTLDTGAAHLHPLRLSFGLARAALKAGVRFFEKTRVIKITRSDPVIAETENGSIKSKFLLLACNGYLGDLDKKTASRVMPINNFILATEPLSESRAREIIRDDVAVADSKFVINYYRLSDDRRLLFGGGENYSYRFPTDIKAFVRKPMLEIYPQLENVKIDFGWGGTLGITMNRMPNFERLAPNILTAGGYSGEGLGMGVFAGAVMAEAIDGTARRFDLLAEIPTRRFPGGTRARSPLLALAMFYYSLRDKI